MQRNFPVGKELTILLAKVVFYRPFIKAFFLIVCVLPLMLRSFFGNGGNPFGYRFVFLKATEGSGEVSKGR